ncbi:phosphoglycerate mutase [Microlunatus endophyticus]|uniref:Phosphoglycerate mutase n=1 Tax=Microlunatus endophyticus TaxID=1716077 RepID=A0A917SHD7_9ACTN|nr:histidine phosphatase family protein [Microlunatus endophyticus]GGL79507.1 phosphoglycerate mutase [Microlunatus endophyticus]
MVDIGEVHVPLTGAVIIVRHGRTALNIAGRLRGRLDPDLDMAGRREVNQLARRLASCNIRKIISSPLKRAQQTAVAIDQMHHVGVATDKRLIDRDYGEHAGALRTDLVAKWGTVDDAPGVEPVEDVVGRAASVLEDLQPELGGGIVVLVAHDAINQAMLAWLGVPGKVTQHTACWNLVTYDGLWNVKAIDQR